MRIGEGDNRVNRVKQKTRGLCFLAVHIFINLVNPTNPKPARAILLMEQYREEDSDVLLIGGPARKVLKILKHRDGCGSWFWAC